MKRLVLTAIIILSVFTSCLKTDPVSPIPEIDFKSFELYYNTADTSFTYLAGLLEFSFIDGDADFGMYEELIDTTRQYDRDNYNLILIAYEKRDGEYFEIPVDTNYPPPYYRIIHDSKLDRVGQNKTIKGIIRVEIQYYLFPQYDTMRYDFYIIDRAMNESNIETTTDIGFSGITPPPAQLKIISR